jgi:ubiquinone/menaquinone biosynthesis C-methylase UbiE
LIKTDKKWPKKIPILTEEQKKISDDWMKYWLEILPKNFGIVAKFGHEYPVKNAPKTFISTLEIGCGDGEHLYYEKLTKAQQKEYIGIDIRKNILSVFKKNHPKIKVFLSDCQKKQEFSDGKFDRVLAIHVLEHLPNLPEAIKELYRVCNKKTGVFSVVLPCEGGWFYSLMRKISSERIFKKRYKMPYKWHIESEHLSDLDEVVIELKKYFDIKSADYFPFKLRFFHINLLVGYTLTPKKVIVNT